MSGKTVETGDTVSVSYVGKLSDGRIFDTNIREVAENPVLNKTSSFTPKNVYTPFKFTVGADQVIQGFDEGVLGMKEGETKTIEMLPEKAYGDPDPLLMRTYPRVDTVEVVEQIPIKDFEEITRLNASTLMKNQTIPWRFWNARILLITDEDILLRNLAEDTVLNMEFGPMEVKVDPNYITMTLTPKEGVTIDTQFGPAVVRQINETDFTLDYNHPLAGETLIFDITVDSIEKAA